MEIADSELKERLKKYTENDSRLKDLVFDINIWLRKRKAFVEVHRIRGARITSEDGETAVEDAWEDIDFEPLQLT